jgi:hypothetical protein
VLRRLPFLKILAIAQIALLVHRHLTHLTASERRRLADLVRRGHRLNAAERRELRELVAKLEPAAFVFGAADHISPIPLKRWRKR